MDRTCLEGERWRRGSGFAGPRRVGSGAPGGAPQNVVGTTTRYAPGGPTDKTSNKKS